MIVRTLFNAASGAVYRYCLRTIVLNGFAAFGIYIMSDAATRDHTPRILPAIHLTASRCLLGWATSMSSMLLSRLRKLNVRGILLSFRAWKASSSGSLDSKYCEILPRHKWSLHVSPHHFSARYSTQSFLSRASWEYFTTLEYEWRVIRGRLPYRWTIWVRALSLWFHLACSALELIYSFGRFTLLHVWLALSA